MTAVNLQFTRPAADGSLLQAGGSLVWTPTQRRIIAGSPDNVVLPVGFDVQLGSAGLQVNVADTNSAWCWRVDEKIYGLPARTIYLAVPAMPAGASVDYTDLVQVDPATLDPLEVPEPAWWAALEVGLNSATPGPPNSLAIGTVTTGAAGSSAAASITGAAPSQTLALTIPRGNTGATGPANSLAIGTVTTGAAGSSAAASITGAAPSQTLALTIPRGNTGATGPANSLAIGTVTTGAPGSSATAAITGAAPAQTLSLGIPQGPVGATGPATTLEVIGTTTGADAYIYPGPQGMKGDKGDKGDAGGIVQSTTLVAGTDLNTLTDAGNYGLVGANATAELNAPNPGTGGVLVVLRRSSTLVTQTFYPLSTSNRGIWQRNLLNTWNPWHFIASARTDQTAGRAMYQWDDLNNREQLIYGDTGWRQVIAPADIAGLPNMYGFIRRVGNQVTFQAYETTAGGTAAGATVLYVTPSGFRFVLGPGGAPAMVAGQVIDSGAMPVANASIYLASAGTYSVTLRAVAGVRHYCTISWLTTDAWPTALPGSAFGSIPTT